MDQLVSLDFLLDLPLIFQLVNYWPIKLLILADIVIILNVKIGEIGALLALTTLLLMVLYRFNLILYIFQDIKLLNKQLILI